jgi:predicted nuclease with TOPRIM domain
MPTAREDIDIQGNRVEIRIEFQMWCANCGNGICWNTEYKSRSTNEFTTFCEVCDKGRKELEEEKDSLESEVVSLRGRIAELESSLTTC